MVQSIFGIELFIYGIRIFFVVNNAATIAALIICKQGQAVMEKFVNHIQLGYLGLLPFLGCVAWPLLLGSNSVNLEFFTFYSIAILAFMAGNLWRAGSQSYSDAIKAVVPVIPIPFLSFLPTEWMLAWLGLSFWLVLLFEKATLQWQSYHADYQKMRFVLTSVVFVCHVFVIGISLYPN